MPSGLAPQLSTAMNAQVALSADGKFSIDTAAEGGKIDLVVDIQGYFLESNPAGGFTPLNGRLIDTRNGSSIASGASFTVQVGGVQGAPRVEGGLSAVAVTFTAVNDSGADVGSEPINMYDATGRAGIPLSNCQTQAINVGVGGLATTVGALSTVAATASGVGVPVGAVAATATLGAATATWTGYNTFLNECLD
ncbi:hypothetical protein [Curtobacterium sp. VKM Ac-1376]|uniref:hypothetical protein n=1 Tax=Curtobacterium sp. VKM Ac-1376 TaxID=123312 RepID=UPI00188A3B12|nr:hypothetical protein [Curtobacterium sp. VKM Ac-1376]MBF4616267.1 hypothetical protein [Curtobacterium sp. VKM Ac-1376]